MNRDTSAFLRRLCAGLGVTVTLLGIVPPALAQPRGPVEPTLYEDRNNNGVFDAGDVDLSGIPAGLNVVTKDSVVINRLSIGHESYIVKRIQAGKRITINGNVAVTGKLGELRLTAGELRISNNASITIISSFEAEISGSVIIGNNVRMQSLGKSPSVGFGRIALRGKTIQAGTGLTVAAFDMFYAEATEGALSLGSLANLRTLSGPISIVAKDAINVEMARSINGAGGVEFLLDNFATGTTDVTGSRLSTSRESQVSFYGGEVHLTPALILAPVYCLYYTSDHPRGVVCVER